MPLQAESMHGLPSLPAVPPASALVGCFHELILLIAIDTCSALLPCR